MITVLSFMDLLDILEEMKEFYNKILSRKMTLLKLVLPVGDT